jgi:hypothetical protein
VKTPLLLATVILALAARPSAAETPASPDVTTAHYDVHAEGMDAQEAGAILEELYKQLTKYFGGSPKGRLVVNVSASKEGFEEALKKDKQGHLESGGYYSPETKKAYLFVQPSAYYTRQLLIHEATHQFHFLVATGNKPPAAAWYAEGLVEYFGMHNWDGKELKTGVVPAVSLEDYPAQALKQLGELKDDITGVATGRTGCDRPLSWALVHYLANRQAANWRSLAALLDEGRKPDKAWEKVFGKTGAEFAKDFRAWLEGHQQPLREIFVTWQERGDAVEGSAGPMGVAVYRSAPDSIAVEVEPVSGTLCAGLAFNFTANDDYCVFRAEGQKAHAMHFLKGTWGELGSADLDGAAKPVLEFKRDGGDAVLSACGHEVYRGPAAGEVGLCVEGCCARFRVKK